MGSSRFTPAVWLFLVFLAYVDAQLAFSTYDIPDTQAGDSITIAYGGTTYPVIFTLINGDSGSSTPIGTSTASPFTFTVPLNQEAAYYTIEGQDSNGGDDSTDSFQITSAPNQPAAPGPAATSSTANRAGATASIPTTALTSTPPATPTTTPAPAALGAPTTSSTSTIPTSPPTQIPRPPSISVFSPSLTLRSTTPTPTPSPQPFSTTPSTHPLYSPPSYPTHTPYHMGSGLFGSNSTYTNGSSASGVITVPSASSSAALMKGLNGSGTRSQFWIVEQKECRGGCGPEAFTGMGVRVMSGGLVGVVGVVVVVVVAGGLMVI